jgi:class 3 adenylate cyclase
VTIVFALVVLASSARAAPVEAPRLPVERPPLSAPALMPSAAASALVPATPYLPGFEPAEPPPRPEAGAPFAAPLVREQGVRELRGAGILAVDFKDSTALHATIGNRRARARIAAALDYAEATAARFNGSVVRRMGDGHAVAFPSADEAIDAALAIQSGLRAWSEAVGAPDVRLRAGVHAGRVLAESDGRSVEVYGQAVERAITLADESRGGDVAVEPGLARRVLSRAAATGAYASYPGDETALIRPHPLKVLDDPLALQAPLSVREFTRAATLFAGLDDWPEVFETRGRRPAYRTAKAFHAWARKTVEAHGGFIVKTEGETVMASFPNAAEALRAGVELQAGLKDAMKDAPLADLVRARVGVGYGRVMREDTLEGPDFYGNTVNAAARLMRLAAPGEVLASGSVLTDPRAAHMMLGRPRSKVPVKGFKDRLTVLHIPVVDR